MYQITWKYEETVSIVSFSNPAEANEFWKLLKQVDCVSMISTAVHKKDQSVVRVYEKKYNVVRVKYRGGNKEYTFLTAKPIPVESHVVVDGFDGPEIVRVTYSGQMTEAQLTNLMPMNKYKYITGIVKPE